VGASKRHTVPIQNALLGHRQRRPIELGDTVANDMTGQLRGEVRHVRSRDSCYGRVKLQSGAKLGRLAARGNAQETDLVEGRSQLKRPPRTVNPSIRGLLAASPEC